MLNPLNSTYLGRWAVRSLNMWAFCTFVALNPWVLLFEHEAVEMPSYSDTCPTCDAESWAFIDGDCPECNPPVGFFYGVRE